MEHRRVALITQLWRAQHVELLREFAEKIGVGEPRTAALLEVSALEVLYAARVHELAVALMHLHEQPSKANRERANDLEFALTGDCKITETLYERLERRRLFYEESE